MSLITCPDCAQQVSSLARECPLCGRPIAPAEVPAPAYAYAYAPAPLDRVAIERPTVQMGYGLYAGSFVVGPLLLASVILAYVKRDSVRGTWLESHYNWLIDTFWAGLAGGMLGGAFALFWLLVFFPLGIILMFAVVFGMLGFSIYRLVRGWTLLSEGKPAVGTLSAPRW